MRVLITGSSGLIGSALVRSLEGDGHSVTRVVRGEGNGTTTVGWNPEAPTIETTGLEGHDAVVHLGGHPIAGQLRWSAEHKARVLESRTLGTRILAEALALLDAKPQVLVSGSAVGFYGDRGDEVLTESSAPGDDFLTNVCLGWEAATKAAEDAGIRVVHARTGIVLDKRDGVLPRLLLPGRFGLGAHFGSGKQWMSWITLADEVRAIRFAIDTPSLRGPVNLTAPNPATNTELTKTLGRVLHRPAVLAVPAPLIRAALGDAGNVLLLSSQRVQPAALQAAGFTFEQPELAGALTAILGK